MKIGSTLRGLVVSPETMLTKDRFANALMEAYAMYQGFNSWAEYAELFRSDHVSRTPCAAGRVAIDFGWIRYNHLPPVDDFERFRAAAFKAEEWYTGAYSKYRVLEVEEIIKKVYERFSNQPR